MLESREMEILEVRAEVQFDGLFTGLGKSDGKRIFREKTVTFETFQDGDTNGTCR